MEVLKSEKLEMSVTSVGLPSAASLLRVGRVFQTLSQTSALTTMKRERQEKEIKITGFTWPLKLPPSHRYLREFTRRILLTYTRVFLVVLLF